MRLRRYYADERRHREAELAEIARWLSAHPVTRCRPAAVARTGLFWPRRVESERMSAVVLKVLGRDEAIARFKPYQLWWRAPAEAPAGA